MSLPCRYSYPNGPSLSEVLETLAAEHPDLADPAAVAQARKYLQTATILNWRYVGLTTTGGVKIYADGITFEKEGQ